jgi:hypothetical protein
VTISLDPVPPCPFRVNGDDRASDDVWDETALIVWAAVGQGVEDRPESRIAFARALHTSREDLLRELLLPIGCSDSWLRQSACRGIARVLAQESGAPAPARRCSA